jgi:hypothetical protein
MHLIFDIVHSQPPDHSGMKLRTSIPWIPFFLFFFHPLHEPVFIEQNSDPAKLMGRLQYLQHCELYKIRKNLEILTNVVFSVSEANSNNSLGGIVGMLHKCDRVLKCDSIMYCTCTLTTTIQPLPQWIAAIPFYVHYSHCSSSIPCFWHCRSSFFDS